MNSTQNTQTPAAGFLSLISPLEQTIYTSVGRNLTLQCSFRGTPNFHDTWLWRGPQRTVNISRMTLSSNTAITTTLRIPSIDHWHFGDYLCRAWNERTTVEGVIHVRYEESATVTTSQIMDSIQNIEAPAAGFLSLISPLEQTIYTSVGRNLILQCSFRGTPNFHYTWLWQDRQGRVNISHLTLGSNTIITTELRIPSISHWHFGDYLCRAWNEHTTVEGVIHVRYEVTASQIMDSTQNTQTPAAGFLSLISPLEQTVYTSVGRNLILQCSFRGTPNFHYTWLWRGPQRTVNISHMTLSSNTIITTTLRIPSISHWHFGDYLCRAWNEHTTVEGVIHVRYEESSTVTTSQIMNSTQNTQTPAASFLSLISPLEQTVYTSVGRNLTLQCSFRGTPNFHYTWLWQDRQGSVVIIRMTLSSNITITTEQTIPSISHWHFGDYLCRAWNEHTTVEGVIHVRYEESATVTTSQIMDSTQNTQTPAASFLSLISPLEQTVYTSVGRNLTLQCSFRGTPNFHYTWLWRGPQRTVNISRMTLSSNTAITTTLRIPSISHWHFGDYLCRAWNEHTTVEGVIHVRYEGEKPQSGGKTGTFSIISVIMVVIVLFVLLLIILLVERRKGDSADAGNPEGPAQKAGGTQQ
ncbi:contactin-5-like isoform X2 [Hemitrygon akajei]|uniref:contactin-5-like isoform X2 n=1 Tax=Hemitrygon akajei TaxID=2704970 RepID=UPI003BF97344